MKHLFVSVSVKQNFFALVFVHKCLMVFNNVKYTTLKMFVTLMSNYLFVISFQLMLYKTLRCSLARPFDSIFFELLDSSQNSFFTPKLNMSAK